MWKKIHNYLNFVIIPSVRSKPRAISPFKYIINIELNNENKKYLFLKYLYFKHIKEKINTLGCMGWLYV